MKVFFSVVVVFFVVFFFGLQESCLRVLITTLFRAALDAHLDVSNNISQFLLRVLQFLHRLQRGFLEFFLREYKRWISHSAVPPAAHSSISAMLHFHEGKF